MTAILLMGFLLGMRHALEADHVAAVATLVARARSTRRAILEGAAWGLGHTLTLFLACSLVLFADAVVSERLARGLETAVGAMLVLLGLDLLRRMCREPIYFHTHRHGDGIVHFHAHSHAGESGPHTRHHRHGHPRSFPVRALCVGLVHGLAGSAALVVLMVGAMVSPLTGLAYVGLFGLGSIGGMALMSLAISVPLRGARRLTWLHNGLQATLAAAAVVLGALLVHESLLVGAV